jgi:predicted GNAT family acetyltransferase
MTAAIKYKMDCANVDWVQMKEILVEDNFDNQRTPEQYRISFENSYAVVVAYDGNNIIGTARVLSDGVCNAYIVDVWTYSPYRKYGIATNMMSMLINKLQGQHIYLFTDDAIDFYVKIGFQEQGTGLGKVVGKWLQNETRDI